MPLPLLRLPENLTVDVLRTFEMRELQGIAISILSKRSSKAVQLLKLRSLAVNLHIGSSISFEVTFNDPTQNLFLDFYWNTKRRNTVLNIPKKVTVIYGNEIDDWRLSSSKMTMKDWYLHIEKTVDACFSIHFKFGFKIFDFESIKKTFKDVEVNELSIAQNIPNNQSRMILEEFLPISHDLRLERSPFQRNDGLRAILIQNQECFRYGTYERVSDFTLNDMLICNFTCLSITLPTWTDSDINRFLKLWIKGACRQLCQLLFIHSPEEWRWNQEEVLKEISFQEVEGDRILGMYDGEVQYPINGGCDIRAMDGRICTIEIEEPNFVMFYFYD
ncbi:hypothetical protein CAEBREN_24841 [Caenorhabditis brenneri]|uniref:Sdz-33 F-box domain-containing protein n=1 Tax=Caenorhabditis brenneri TaxID=135651 RepID=G0MC57_CAEBE|nr:hypothetical protein CAEBREN_24841 [Caenorhabditis brenneri]